MELRELTQPEQKYTYRQSHQLDAQTGCIGYLRGDFGTTGKEFYSSWFDSMAYLKTPEFQAELDRVINALREDSQYSGILADRSSLSNVCRQTFGREESGFRVNTQDYAYLLRLNPNRGEYNFYIYCYKRDYLDRHIRNAEYGIRFITPNYKEKFRMMSSSATVWKMTCSLNPGNTTVPYSWAMTREAFPDTAMSGEPLGTTKESYPAATSTIPSPFPETARPSMFLSLPLTH